VFSATVTCCTSAWPPGCVTTAPARVLSTIGRGRVIEGRANGPPVSPVRVLRAVRDSNRFVDGKLGTMSTTSVAERDMPLMLRESGPGPCADGRSGHGESSAVATAGTVTSRGLQRRPDCCSTRAPRTLQPERHSQSLTCLRGCCPEDTRGAHENRLRPVSPSRAHVAGAAPPSHRGSARKW